MPMLVQAVLSLLAILIGSSAGFALPNAQPVVISATTSAQVAGTYRIVRVVDGDTAVASIDGVDVTLRLIGLDTPETVDPRRSVQCYGREASAKAKELLTGASVVIETDPSQGALDKYGRTLVYIFLPDGTLFNEYMIAEGFGHEYTYAIPYRYRDQFRAAEAAAKQDRRGLWAEGACDDYAASPTAAPNIQSASGSEYTCSSNAYDCADFATQAAAQEAFELCGGSMNDIHRLDRDHDGRVCETLP